MVEKMTAVWLIILTILACSAVPGVLIWLTASSAGMVIPFHLHVEKVTTFIPLH
ncbi:MAG TPA: hypothetical protein VNI77_10655 [Nitrososphaera sp.]|nr:hypothetical protein [Nitrososphaera sp.]